MPNNTKFLSQPQRSKLKDVKNDPSKEVSSGGAGNGLFVSQNEPSNVATNAHLKRPRSEFEEKPPSIAAAPAPRKRANKGCNKNWEPGYDDFQER